MVCKKSLYVLFVTLLIFGATLFGGANAVSAAIPITGIPSTIELDGYMWSSTIGWISLNCKTGSVNAGSVCSTSDYRVTIGTNGNLTGYGWSNNVGWIRFGGLSNFPVADGVAGTAAASARVIGTYPTDVTFDGWARACSGTISGLDVNGDTTCGNMNSRLDGWDGWIALRGTSYELRFQSDGTMILPTESGATSKDGYFWGSTNVGWIVADDSLSWSQITVNLIGNSCIIPANGSTCKGLVNWKFTPANITSPTIYQTTPVSSAAATNIASSTNVNSLKPTLTYGVNYRYEARSGSTYMNNAVVLTANCDTAAGYIWQTATSPANCIFDTTKPPKVSLTLDAKARSIVRAGNSAGLNWSFESVLAPTNCVLSGPTVPTNYMKDTSKVPVTNSSGHFDTGPLTSYSTFTFSCVNGVLTDQTSISVDVVPTIKEN